ncbi:unnamed protein product [Coregonus sp. 'balchen']|nr:unnamed protein product [Coregonus sp. 'balchen']
MPVMGAPSLLFLLLLSPSLGEDTVAEDMGVHQLGRLVELLTSRECEDLLSALSHPEENIFQQLDHLSLENNQLDLQKRVKRDTEVGKNINQDKTLSMKKYVEEYHQRVSSIESPLVQSETEEHHELIWSDLELVVERDPVQPYQRRLLDGAWPLVYGVMLGFAGTFLMGVPILLFLLYISRGDQKKLLRRSYKTRGPSSSSHGRYRRSRQKPIAGAGDVASAEMAPQNPLRHMESHPRANEVMQHPLAQSPCSAISCLSLGESSPTPTTSLPLAQYIWITGKKDHISMLF